MEAFKPGDKAYIIESNISIREVVIRSISGGFCVVEYDAGSYSSGAIRVRESRLYRTKEEAEDKLPEKRKRMTGRSPWDHRYQA